MAAEALAIERGVATEHIPAALWVALACAMNDYGSGATRTSLGC